MIKLKKGGRAKAKERPVARQSCVRVDCATLILLFFVGKGAASLARTCAEEREGPSAWNGGCEA